jgi:hypothetical protein
MAILDVPTQTSSQNLTLASLPNFHLYPNLATLAIHRTPFQKLEAPLSTQVNTLGLQLSYLNSTTCFYILPLSKLYLLIHEPNKHKFNSLRLGTPNPPNCRKNRLRIIVGYIALCLSAGIYRVQES